MSLHWTIIAGFLYAEIGFMMALLIPFISTRMWHRLFKSRFLRGLESQLIYYFYVLVAILILFFLDAIREMTKYSSEEKKDEPLQHLDSQMQIHMRLFRAQRNFYISGFALFLCLVIKRMVSLISANATLQAETEAAMKQAQSATRAAETLLKSDGEAGDSAPQVKELQAALDKAQAEKAKAVKDVESMKTQSENLAAEYDRLMAEKDKLEMKLNIQGEKKDD